MNEIISNNGFSNEQNQQLINLLALLNGNNSINHERPRRLKVSEGAERYIEIEGANISNSTKSIVRYAYKHFITYFVTDKFLDEVMTKEEILGFKNYLFSKVNSGVYWKHFRSCFSTLSNLNYFDRNYFIDVKFPEFQKPEILVMSRGELERIREYLPLLISDMVLFAYLNGLRVGELVNLAWSEVKLTKRLIVVGSKLFTTKSKKIRQIPLNEESYNILIKYFPKTLKIHKAQYVFHKSSGYKYGTDFISKSFKHALRKTDLNPDLHFHNLRSSYATNLSEAGVPIVQIKELLGHSSIDTTMRYATTHLSSLRDAVAVLDNYSSIVTNSGEHNV